MGGVPGQRRAGRRALEDLIPTEFVQRTKMC